jgi:hypothetical protein
MKDCITVRGDGVAGWQEIVCDVKREIKSDNCFLTAVHKSLSHCSIMCCVRLRKFLLHEITSLLSSAVVRNAWRYTSSLPKPCCTVIQLCGTPVFVYKITRDFRNSVVIQFKTIDTVRN